MLSHINHLYKHSRGQVAVIFTLAVVTLVGAMALGTDVAVLYYNWMQLQKAADSAALAGANYLPTDTTDASSQAIAFAENNGMKASEIDTPTLSNSDTEITVAIHRAVPYYFARVLGLTSGQVSVQATARAPYSPTTIGSGPSSSSSGSGSGSSGSGSSGGGSSGGSTGTPVTPSDCGSSTGQFDVLPIAVSDSTSGVYVNGNSYTLNRTGGTGNGAWVDAPGNWGAVSLCGNSGGAALRTSIASGFYGPISVGQTLTTDPGAKVGPLSQGFADRIGASPDNPNTFSPNDPRAVIVPTVSGFSSCTGSCTVTITGFLAFYIDSYSGGAITGHFVTKETLEASPGDPLAYGGGLSNGVRGDPILIK